MKPTILPQKMPLGEVDEDELFFADNSEQTLNLPPAISQTERMLLFTRLINAGQKGINGSYSLAQASYLATELSKLFDTVENEELNFSDLADLVPAEYAVHWQKTLDFLKIVTEVFPKIMEERGVIGPAQRKIALFTLCTGIMICGVVLWILINKQQETKSEIPKGCEEQSACSIDEADNQKDDWFIGLTMEDALQKLENQEDGVYYFGYEDCPWCQDAAPVLKEVAQEHQKKVYYIRTRDEDHNLLYDDEQKERIINYLGEYMETNEDGQLTLYVPMVVEMKNGKVKNTHIGTVDSYDPNEREMTEEETKQLKDIYEAFFKE